MNLQELRRALIRLDDLDAAMQELGFAVWCMDTLFPQRVDRWIREIGGVHGQRSV